MALYPKATHKLLPQNSRQARINPISVVYHTAVSNGSDLYAFFNGRSAGVESHFYVRSDGSVLQYMDTNRRADCQLGGNPYAVSIETQDNAPRYPSQIVPWTDAQVNALVELTVWLCKTHDIPAVMCPAYNRPGLGYHKLFTKPKPHTDCWNNTHDCPGPKRIAQIPAIVSRVQSGLKGVPSVPTSAYLAFPGASTFQAGATSDTIGRMNMRLRAVGLPAPASRTFDAASKSAYAAWQRKLGYSGADADGIPGQGSWDRLQVSKTGALPPTPAPKPAEKTTDQKVSELHALLTQIGTVPDGEMHGAGWFVAHTLDTVQELQAQVDTVNSKLEALTALIEPQKEV